MSTLTTAEKSGYDTHVAIVSGNPHGVTAANSGAVPTTRLVSAGTGLSGGGALSADRTLAVAFGTTAGTVCAGDDGRLSGGSSKNLATRDLLIIGVTLGTTQPLSITDATFSVAAQTVADINTTTPGVGLAAGAFASSGAEIGTAGTQGGLGSAAAANQPYNSTDFPGYRAARVLLTKIDDDAIVVSDVNPGVVGADAGAPVYGYLAYRSDLGANLKWRLWFYYRRSGDGVEVPITPTTSLTGCKMHVVRVTTQANMAGNALLFPSIAGQAPAAPIAYLSPATETRIIEDFTGINTSATMSVTAPLPSGFLAFSSGTGASVQCIVPSTDKEVGLVQLQPGTTTTGYASVYNRALGTGGTSCTYKPVTAAQTLVDMKVSIPTLSTGVDTFVTLAGLFDQISFLDGIYFSHDANSDSHWIANVKSSVGAHTTSVTTAISVVAAQFYRLVVIKRAGADIADFYIDGVLVATISADVPTTIGLFQIVRSLKSAGTAASKGFVNVDWCGLDDIRAR